MMKRLLCLLFFCLLPVLVCAESSLQIQVDSTVRCYSENVISVTAPADGSVTLTVSAGEQVYQTLSCLPVQSGTNSITWDGLGPWQERIPDGNYTLSAAFSGKDGSTGSADCTVTVGKCPQVLQYVLPSSGTLYLDDEKTWFVQLELIRRGKVVMEVCTADAPETPVYTKKFTINGGARTYYWQGTGTGKEKLAPGSYILRWYAADNPAYSHEFSLTVSAGTTPELPLQLTGPVIPSRTASDEEVWSLMQQPSAVLVLGETSHQKVYSKPSAKSDSLGTLHGGSQCVEILSLDTEGWAYIGAWNHETGSYVEGYVPTDKLKMVTPSSDYGLLIDKQTQTMKVYFQGKVIAELPVSTGKVAKNKMIRETAAGSFLTVSRIGAFSTGGFTYSYPIRYDGGNLIHSTGYQFIRPSKDRNYTQELAQLGSKSSHGCIRVPAFNGEDGITAWWLYSHLPWHTRVIILDDADNRRIEAALVGSYISDMSYTGSGTNGADTEAAAASSASEADVEEESVLPAATTELVLTLGGDAVLGTREIWQDDSRALPAYLEQYGFSWFFSGLSDYFTTDDMTFINLECVLKDTSSGENKTKLYRFRGLPSYAGILTAGSVEQVNIANNHYIDYGTAGRESTLLALQAEGIPYSGYTCTYIWEKDGYRIGFAGCRETVYKKDHGIIAREITALKDAGCDVVIYSCHWGTEYQAYHNGTQLAMAQAAVDAGADLVVGNHPHVVQGLASLDGVPVIWSLGNLMFGGTLELTTYDAAIARVTLRFDEDGYSGCLLSYIPIQTSSRADEGINDYHPVPAEGKDAKRILALIQADTDFTLTDTMYFPAK